MTLAVLLLPILLPPTAVDFHVHVFSDKNFGAEGNPSTSVLETMDEASVARAVIYSSGWQFTDRAKVEAENSSAASMAAKHASRLLALCAVPLTEPWIAEELRRCKQLGLRGLKLHPNANKLDLRTPADLKRLQDAVAAAATEGFKVVVLDSLWNDSRVTQQLTMLAGKHRGVAFVFAHAFFRNFRDLGWIALQKRLHRERPLDNVFVDTSVVAEFYAGSPEAESLVWHLRQLGVAQVVLGSDFPLGSPRAALEAIAKLPFTAEERRAIQGENAARLLELLTHR